MEEMLANIFPKRQMSSDSFEAFQLLFLLKLIYRLCVIPLRKLRSHSLIILPHCSYLVACLLANCFVYLLQIKKQQKC